MLKCRRENEGRVVWADFRGDNGLCFQRRKIFLFIGQRKPTKIFLFYPPMWKCRKFELVSQCKIKKKGKMWVCICFNPILGNNFSLFATDCLKWYIFQYFTFYINVSPLLPLSSVGEKNNFEQMYHIFIFWLEWSLIKYSK